MKGKKGLRGGLKLEMNRRRIRLDEMGVWEEKDVIIYRHVLRRNVGVVKDEIVLGGQPRFGNSFSQHQNQSPDPRKTSQLNAEAPWMDSSHRLALIRRDWGQVVAAWPSMAPG